MSSKVEEHAENAQFIAGYMKGHKEGYDKGFADGVRKMQVENENIVLKHFKDVEDGK